MGGAFSAGAPGTAPFIVMSFDGTGVSLGTLAHELGHSMHSYLTWRTQPQVYTHYSMFVAEVASNFHQVMLRAHLLDNVDDPALQLAVLEEAMANFRRYFFIMPTLARFEREIHERVAQGEGLTAELLCDRMADLFAEGYGPERRARPRSRRDHLGGVRAPLRAVLRLPVRDRDLGRARARAGRARRRAGCGRPLSRVPLGRELALSARGAPAGRRRPDLARARRADVRRALVTRRPDRGTRLCDGDRARSRPGPDDPAARAAVAALARTGFAAMSAPAGRRSAWRRAGRARGRRARYLDARARGSGRPRRSTGTGRRLRPRARDAPVSV